MPSSPSLLSTSLAGSLLLESLKEHISTTAQDHCKAIYLHVLTTNSAAISFYENRDFTQHHYLPYYYSIRGVLKDGFTYVLYLNGGHPPWTILYPSLIGSRPTGPIALGCLLVAFTSPAEGVMGGSIMHMGKCWAGAHLGAEGKFQCSLDLQPRRAARGRFFTQVACDLPTHPPRHNPAHMYDHTLLVHTPTHPSTCHAHSRPPTHLSISLPCIWQPTYLFIMVF